MDDIKSESDPATHYCPHGPFYLFNHGPVLADLSMVDQKLCCMIGCPDSGSVTSCKAAQANCRAKKKKKR